MWKWNGNQYSNEKTDNENDRLFLLFYFLLVLILIDGNFNSNRLVLMK